VSANDGPALLVSSMGDSDESDGDDGHGALRAGLCCILCGSLQLKIPSSAELGDSESESEAVTFRLGSSLLLRSNKGLKLLSARLGQHRPPQRPAEQGPLKWTRRRYMLAQAHFQAKAAVNLNGTAAAVPLRLCHVASPFNWYVPSPLRLRWLSVLSYNHSSTCDSTESTIMRILSYYYLKQQDRLFRQGLPRT
jgi:hypothetical protein